MPGRLLPPILAFSLALSLQAQQFSELWGENGEKWDPKTSRLRDFTTVGYMKGAVPIPDWPIGNSVRDFGANPDDNLDDSQAFIAAIAACPPKHAVLVPKGRYVILKRSSPSATTSSCAARTCMRACCFSPSTSTRLNFSA